MLGINFEDNSRISMPNISHTIEFSGFGSYTLHDEYIDYGGGDQLKFSKALDSTLLNTLLESSSFTRNKGEFKLGIIRFT